MAYKAAFYHIKTATRRAKAVLLQYSYLHFVAMSVFAARAYRRLFNRKGRKGNQLRHDSRWPVFPLRPLRLEITLNLQLFHHFLRVAGAIGKVQHHNVHAIGQGVQVEGGVAAFQQPLTAQAVHFYPGKGLGALHREQAVGGVGVEAQASFGRFYCMVLYRLLYIFRCFP